MSCLPVFSLLTLPCLVSVRPLERSSDLIKCFPFLVSLFWYFMNFSYSPSAYNFGLGKRSETFDYDDDLQLAEQLLNNWEAARLVDNDMPSDYEVDSFRGSK